MRVDDLTYGKSRCKGKYIDKAISKTEDEKVTVKLSGHDFNILNYNCGGIIKSNCEILYEKDLDIITSMNLEYLHELSRDLEYLNDLVKNRIKEFLDPRDYYSLTAYTERVNRKKFKFIRLTKYIETLDKYGDSELGVGNQIESYEIPDVKGNRQEINRIIEELKTKYKLTVEQCYIR